MSDIPEDIIRAAKAVMTKNGFENAESDTFTTLFVAKAIIAERERCAKLAEAVPPAKDIISTERWIPITDDYGEPTGLMMKQGPVHRVNFRRSIAAAIRALDCFPEVGE